MVGRTGSVPPAGLVGSGDREVAIDLDVDEGRTTGGKGTAHGRLHLIGCGCKFAVDPERPTDRREVRRVKRAVRRYEVGPGGAAEERLLAALDADPARVVEDDRADR